MFIKLWQVSFERKSSGFEEPTKMPTEKYACVPFRNRAVSHISRIILMMLGVSFEERNAMAPCSFSCGQVSFERKSSGFEGSTKMPTEKICVRACVRAVS